MLQNSTMAGFALTSNNRVHLYFYLYFSIIIYTLRIHAFAYL